MTDQPGDYYVSDAVSWIDGVEGLSDADREAGREVFAQLLAHHDVMLHKYRVSFDECLQRARDEFAAAEPVGKLDPPVTVRPLTPGEVRDGFVGRMATTDGYTLRTGGHLFPIRAGQVEPDEDAHCRICGVSYIGTGPVCDEPCKG